MLQHSGKSGGDVNLRRSLHKNSVYDSDSDSGVYMECRVEILRRETAVITKTAQAQ